jgi:hypothetical protein
LKALNPRHLGAVTQSTVKALFSENLDLPSAVNLFKERKLSNSEHLIREISKKLEKAKIAVRYKDFIKKPT